MDDEYLRQILTAAQNVNNVAHDLTHGPIARSWERRPHILKTFFHNLREHPNEPLGPASYQVDLVRFNSAVSSIVRGLYFVKFQLKLDPQIEIASTLFRHASLEEGPVSPAIRRAENEVPVIYEGIHREVFKYNFGDDPTGELGVCRLRFYDGEPIYAIWHL